MRTGSPRPPLTKRLKPRHWTAIDCVVAAALGLILFATVRKGFAEGVVAPGVPGFVRPVQSAEGFVLLLVAMAVLAVALRRRRPTFMLGLLLAGSLVAV